MDISLATVSLAYLGIPGGLALLLSRRLFRLSPRNNFETFFVVFLYSMAAYQVADIVASPPEGDKELIVAPIVERLLDGSQSVTQQEVLTAAVAGVLLAAVVSLAHTHNIISRLGIWLRLTRRFGDEDVWHFLQNMPDSEKNDGWVFVRDHQKQLVYYGWIAVWSDSNETRELIIADVDVFANDTGEYLYSCNSIYISREHDDITIEVPRHPPQPAKEAAA